MKASRNAYELIKHYEGLKLRSYMCMAGKCTIGWGHTGDDIGHGMIIGLADAERYLLDDVAYLELRLTKMILREITQNQFDACISLSFNIGDENFRKSTLLKFLNFGEFKKAAEEFLNWRYVKLPNGKKQIARGLMTRRATERHLFLTGKLDFTVTSDRA